MKDDSARALQPGVTMDAATANEVAKIACALKSLSACTTLMLEQEDDSEGLQQTGQTGLAAMKRIFRA